MLEKILPAFKSKKLSTLNRYGIVDDLFALVKVGKIPATQFLNLLSACSNEDEYIVWSAIIQGISELRNVLEHYNNDKLTSQFNTFVCKVIEPVANRLKWEPSLSEGNIFSIF